MSCISEEYTAGHAKDLKDLFCNVCLSKDRRLSELGDYTEIFGRICSEISDIKVHMICWECKAILRKAKGFQQKAINAQIIISYEFPPKFSLSTITPIVLVENPKQECQEMDEILDENEIKIEPIEIKITEDLNEDCDKHQSLLVEDGALLENLQANNVKFDEISRKVCEKQQNAICFLDEMPLSKRKELKLNSNHDKSFTLEVNKQIEIEQEHTDDEIEYDFNDSVYSPTISSDMNKDVPVKVNKMKRKYVFSKGNDSARLSFKWIKTTIASNMNVDKIGSEEIENWRAKERESEYFKDATFKCESCIIRFKDQRGFYRHKRRYHDKSYKEYCTICLRYFPGFDTEDHKKWHCTIYKCECGYQSYTREHMTWHKKRVHWKLVQCLKCEHTFRSLTDYYKHYKTYHSQFICDICGQRRATRETMINHLKYHRFPKDCAECHAKSSNYNAFMRHKHKAHGKRPKKEESKYCVLCDKTFLNAQRYNYHVSTTLAHRQERNKKPPEKHKCTDCDKVYARKKSLNNHYNFVHLKKYRYSCSKCDMNFLKSTGLLRHEQRVHLGIAPVKDKPCSICGRAFSLKRILMNHMQTHTGERPFECAHCDAKFAQKAAMVMHVKHIHLGVKRKLGDDNK